MDGLRYVFSPKASQEVVDSGGSVPMLETVAPLGSQDIPAARKKTYGA